jgi:putative intracellular protease/amidase
VPGLLSVALALFLVAGIALTFNLNRLRDSFAWVEHTDEVLRNISAVDRALLQAESGERGYLLTGGDSYRDSYAGASAEIDADAAYEFPASRVPSDRIGALGSFTRHRRRRWAGRRAEDKHSIKLIESFLAARKPIATVCHSTGALRHVKTPDGKLLVQGKEVTGFTNGEEAEVGLTKIVPFLVEDEMLRLGAIFSKKANWAPHVVSDGLLITGQNPHSSGPAAKTLMAALKQRAKPTATARAS